MYNPNQKYYIKTDQYDIPFEQYTDFDKKYGHFSEDAKAYIVTDKNTPRQWLNFMVNDNFASVAANDGTGFTAYKAFFMRVTRYYSETDYLVRTLDGKRRIYLEDTKTGVRYDVFKDSEDFRFTVRCGSSVYSGNVGGIRFEITLFVPNGDTCEFWKIRLGSCEPEREIKITVGEDIGLIDFKNEDLGVFEENQLEEYAENGAYYAVSRNCSHFKELTAFFAMKDSSAQCERLTKTAGERTLTYTRVMLSKTVRLDGEYTEYVIAGANESRALCEQLVKKNFDAQNIERELEAVNAKWEAILSRNTCNIPDKNLQAFLNVWLKNQLYMTMRYSRFDIIGYRDLMQDTWGHLLVEPADCKARLMEALTKMYPDGRSPRRYDRIGDSSDLSDFMDGPLWIPILLDGYIKETGDFGILDEETGYYRSDKIGSVAEHILISLDYLYHSRGKNGLLLMRRGDWLDGLEGICDYGEATTVWGTIAAFYAQNIMAKIFRRIGNTETAELLETRSAEYKRIVNDVAWDGNWFAYAFVDDKPLGSNSEPEGKIYANPQNWAIFTGIADDKKRIDKMERAVRNYLICMYGMRMMAPPYTAYGEKCGRLKSQRPGTFANGAVYLHAASFGVYAKCKLQKYDDALDTMQRILPNHSDNPDARRTSEPYSVGNVYYGMDHPCAGLNLYSWFTATPAWLIHGGFDKLLGVEADFDGIKIETREIDGWEEYEVVRTFRGTKYTIKFKKSEQKGIWLDGVLQQSNIIRSDKKSAEVFVGF